MKAEEAFYGRANQSGAVRKLPQSQAGTLSEWNAPQSLNNNYRQGGYQNWSQQFGSVTASHQDNHSGQKDPNAMDVDQTQE